MSSTLFLVFVPFTLVYLIVMGISIVFLHMGMSVLVVGKKYGRIRNSPIGLLALLFSAIMIALVSYAYFEWVWIF
jgi:hypothetical protein